MTLLTRQVLMAATTVVALTACDRLPQGMVRDLHDQEAGLQWEAHDRCVASWERLAACPRDETTRRRRRDDCTVLDRVARLHDPGYPRCPEPSQARPTPQVP